jgi:hypothetical protein
LGSPAERERDPERQRRERVGEIVERVAEQRDRAAKHDDDGLGDRGDAEDYQRDLQRADPFPIAFEHVVDLIDRVVGVHAKDASDPCDDSAACVCVTVVVVMLVRGYPGRRSSRVGSSL